MIFSKTCKAALKSVAFLANSFPKTTRYSIKELAKLVEENDHTIGKALQILVKQEIISSAKGPSGGFFLEKFQMKIPVLKIVETIDGKFELNQCLLGFSKCSEKQPCAFHDEFKKSRKTIENILLKNKIEDLGKSINRIKIT
jgi:Rrf2 family protein